MRFCINLATQNLLSAFDSKNGNLGAQYFASASYLLISIFFGLRNNASGFNLSIGSNFFR